MVDREEAIFLQSDAAPNNGMHPTPHHEASHGSCVGARVMPGVRLLIGGNVKPVLLIILYCALCSVSLNCSRANGDGVAAEPSPASQSNQNTSVVQQTPDPSPTPLSEKDLKEREKIHKAMLAGNYQHDGALQLQTLGDMSSVPALLKVLEDNPPKHGGVLCTVEHAVAALKKVTKHDAGFSYEKWKEWWEQYQKEHPQD